jgi:hypothetical protein
MAMRKHPAELITKGYKEAAAKKVRAAKPVKVSRKPVKSPSSMSRHPNYSSLLPKGS